MPVAACAANIMTSASVLLLGGGNLAAVVEPLLRRVANVVRVADPDVGSEEKAAGSSVGRDHSDANVIVSLVDDEERLRKFVHGQFGSEGGGNVLHLIDLGLPHLERTRRLADACHPIGIDVHAGHLSVWAEAGALRSLVYAQPRSMIAGALAPIFDAMGGVVPVSNPKLIGLLCDLLSGVNLAVAREAVRIGFGAGIDPDVLLGLLQRGSAANAMLSDASVVAAPSRHAAGGFDERSALARDRLRVAVDAARAYGHSTFFGALALTRIAASARAAVGRVPG